MNTDVVIDRCEGMKRYPQLASDFEPATTVYVSLPYISAGARMHPYRRACYA